MSNWAGTWKDILQGGNPRWKITSEECHAKAYTHFKKYVPLDRNTDHNNNNNHHHEEKKKQISVLCPLAGDDPFIFLLYQKGYSVTAIDLVEDAINALKQRFDQGSPDTTTNTTAAAADATSCCWTKTHEPDGDLIWKHRNGRVTFIVGDVTKPRPAFVNSFDAVYDKDSFGALPMTVRPAFCHRMLEYTKDRAILYLECKVKPGHHNATTTTVDTMGPPYSLRYEDIMDPTNYGGINKFEYIAGLGPVYDLPSQMGGMQQTGHILQRTER